MSLGKLGVWYFTDSQDAASAAQFAQKVESMGYGTLWIPETVGRHPFVHAGWLLSHTKTLNVATGIASIYNRDPGSSMAGARSLAEQSGGRFVLGLGVSHQPLVEKVRGNDYGKPYTTMKNYLERMYASPYTAVPPAVEPKVVIAALGPRMLELAGTVANGAHPYFTTPEHTRQAREIMGPDALLCVEQKVVLEPDPVKARELARSIAKIYTGLPNYRNNWIRLGFTEDEINDGGNDRFIDATFAHGDLEAIKDRVNAHLEAGADHVCVQPVNPNGAFGEPHLEVLEGLASMNG